MRLLIILVLTLTISYQGFSCECKFRDVKTELNLSKEVLVGQLTHVTNNSITVKVLKTWKGLIKEDSLTIKLGMNGDGCYRRTLYPTNEYFLIYWENGGIHYCSRTIEYVKSKDIKTLDSIFSKTLWTNDKYNSTLSRLEYSREFIIQTDKGEIDIKGKKIVYNFEGNVKTKENLPQDLNDFYPVRYFLVATKDTIFDNPCGIDYIFYVNMVHQDMTMTDKFRQKIQKKSMRVACR